MLGKLDSLLGQEHYLTRLIRNILINNFIRVDDNRMESDPIEQTIGVLQGDPLSPLLFNIATMDVTQIIEDQDVSIYMYADDMVLVSKSLERLQATFNRLANWADKNEIRLNENKTVFMTFRKVGRLPANHYV